MLIGRGKGAEAQSRKETGRKGQRGRGTEAQSWKETGRKGQRGRAKMVPFLETLSDLAGKGVKIRLIHAGEAGPAFRRDFDKYPRLLAGLERKVCPRVHFKCVVVDGVFAYSGSANLTGAGMGAKSSSRRNFRIGDCYYG